MFRSQSLLLKFSPIFHLTTTRYEDNHSNGLNQRRKWRKKRVVQIRAQNQRWAQKILDRNCFFLLQINFSLYLRKPNLSFSLSLSLSHSLTVSVSHSLTHSLSLSLPSRYNSHTPSLSSLSICECEGEAYRTRISWRDIRRLNIHFEWSTIKYLFDKTIWN